MQRAGPYCATLARARIAAYDLYMRILMRLFPCRCSFCAHIGVANFRTLKRRKAGFIGQVPLPDELLDDLDRSLDLRTRQRHPARAYKRL